MSLTFDTLQPITMSPMIRGSSHPLDESLTRATTQPLPPNISITLGNLIYVENKDLSDVFLDRLMRLAAFQNPEFYRAQSMRLSIFGKLRVISCAEDLRHHIALPRGLLKEVLDLFDSHRIAVKVTDYRFGGVPVEFDFHGDRRPTQIEAAKTLAASDEGILCAPTAFGKTAVAAKPDCVAQGKHPGAGPSPSTNGPVAGETGDVPRSRHQGYRSDRGW
jgi:hypothetical protein